MQNVLLLGAASILGAATAARLSKDGINVILVDEAEEFEKNFSEAKALYPCLYANLSELDSVKICVGAIVEEYGSISGSVNMNPAKRFGVNLGSLLDMDATQWQTVVRSNFQSTLNCVYASLPHLIQAGGGTIVSVAGFEGLRGSPGSSIFSASMAGIIVFSGTLLRECKSHNIRLNSILPAPKDYLRHDGDADAFADAVSFLLSERAGALNGICLDATGGIALH